jgi:hypothetical protein
MKSTMYPAGELHDIPSMSGTAQYAGIEYAELPVILAVLHCAPSFQAISAASSVSE